MRLIIGAVDVIELWLSNVDDVCDVLLDADEEVDGCRFSLPDRFQRYDHGLGDLHFGLSNTSCAIGVGRQALI